MPPRVLVLPGRNAQGPVCLQVACPIRWGGLPKKLSTHAENEKIRFIWLLPFCVMYIRMYNTKEWIGVLAEMPAKTSEAPLKSMQRKNKEKN